MILNSGEHYNHLLWNYEVEDMFMECNIEYSTVYSAKNGWGYSMEETDFDYLIIKYPYHFKYVHI